EDVDPGLLALDPIGVGGDDDQVVVVTLDLLDDVERVEPPRLVVGRADPADPAPRGQELEVERLALLAAAEEQGLRHAAGARPADRVVERGPPARPALRDDERARAVAPEASRVAPAADDDRRAGAPTHEVEREAGERRSALGGAQDEEVGLGGGLDDRE